MDAQVGGQRQGRGQARDRQRAGGWAAGGARERKGVGTVERATVEQE